MYQKNEMALKSKSLHLHPMLFLLLLWTQWNLGSIFLMEVDEEYFGDHDDDNDGVSYEGD